MRILSVVYWYLAFITIPITALAQHISFRNPSLEGRPGKEVMPPLWNAASGTPDTQPGMFSVALPASSGKTYVGMHSGPDYIEGMEQELKDSLQAGLAYRISFNLAFNYYGSTACYASLAIFGGNAPGDTAQLLWLSERFTHLNWERDSAEFIPSASYKYISFWAYPTKICGISSTGITLLIDGLSVIRQVLQLQVTAQPSCNNAHTGAAQVKVAGGRAPFRYLWQPGNDTTRDISNARPGSYEVTVTAANGVTASSPVGIPESDLRTGATVTLPTCGAADDGKIILHAQQGVPPYEYRLANGDWQTDSVLARLKSGYYRYEIRDRRCSVADTVDAISPWKRCTLIMPTAFSPNRDGANDVLRPKVYDNVSNYRLRVYNRWGALVFQSADPATGWDGTYGGALQGPQTFIYICTYHDRNNEPRELKGTVTLVH